MPVAFGVGVIYGALMVAYGCGLGCDPLVPPDAGILQTADSARAIAAPAGRFAADCLLGIPAREPHPEHLAPVLSLPAKIDGLAKEKERGETIESRVEAFACVFSYARR